MRRAVVGVVGAVAALLLLASAPASATTTVYEAEGAAAPASCWSTGTSVAGYSGTGYRSCNEAGHPNLLFTVTVPAGETADVVVFGRISAVALGTQAGQVYRDGVSLGNIDASVADTWRILFVDNDVPAGTYEYGVGRRPSGTLFVDFVQMLGEPVATTTTTAAPTTTTTAAPTTTTTAAPTTTTTAPTTTTVPAGPSQLVTPDNTTRQGLGVLVLLATAYFVFKVGR